MDDRLFGRPAHEVFDKENSAAGGETGAFERDRERLQDLEKATRDIAQALAKDGPTADELTRAVAPIVSNNERSRKLNNYWAQMLQGDLDDPRYIAIIRTQVTGYQAVTAADVKRVAKKWLSKEPALRVEVKGAPKS